VNNIIRLMNASDWSEFDIVYDDAIHKLEVWKNHATNSLEKNPSSSTENFVLGLDAVIGAIKDKHQNKEIPDSNFRKAMGGMVYNMMSEEDKQFLSQRLQNTSFETVQELTTIVTSLLTNITIAGEKLGKLGNGIVDAARIVGVNKPQSSIIRSLVGGGLSMEVTLILTGLMGPFFTGWCSFVSTLVCHYIRLCYQPNIVRDETGRFIVASATKTGLTLTNFLCRLLLGEGLYYLPFLVYMYLLAWIDSMTNMYHGVVAYVLGRVCAFYRRKRMEDTWAYWICGIALHSIESFCPLVMVCIACFVGFNVLALVFSCAVQFAVQVCGFVVPAAFFFMDPARILRNIGSMVVKQIVPHWYAHAATFAFLAFSVWTNERRKTLQYHVTKNPDYACVRNQTQKNTSNDSRIVELASQFQKIGKQYFWNKVQYWSLRIIYSLFPVASAFMPLIARYMGSSYLTHNLPQIGDLSIEDGGSSYWYSLFESVILPLAFFTST